MFINYQFTIFFTDKPVVDFTSVKACDAERYARFFRHMRDKGIFLAPSAFETAMVSFAHTEADFAATLAAARTFAG